MERTPTVHSTVATQFYPQDNKEVPIGYGTPTGNKIKLCSMNIITYQKAVVKPQKQKNKKS